MTLIGATLLTVLTAQRSVPAWPQILPRTERVAIDLRAEQIVVDVPIRTRAGHVAYHFACRGGAERYLDSLKGNWAGPLMCTLAEGERASETSLLSEDDSPAWFSRGQFRGDDLIGDCAKYPEYGAHRSFRLRGMRLTLDAEHIASDGQGAAQSFELVLSVLPERSATTAQAERPEFLDPRRQGRTCRVVLPGREPRMCREAGGSFARCRD